MLQTNRQMTQARRLFFAFALFACAWSGCDSRAKHGERCYSDKDCADGLVCRSLSCRTSEEAFLFDTLQEQLAEQAQKEAQEKQLAKERSLLAQSGVEPPKQAERPPSPPIKNVSAIGSGKVRVSLAKGNAPIFAACRLDERLIAGGCKALDLNAAISQSFPSHFDADDTRGGRWNCHAVSSHSEKPLEAYALCQALVGS